MANTVTGLAQLSVAGGTGGGAGTNLLGFSGGVGYVRVDAFNLSGFNPTTTYTISSGAPVAIPTSSLPTLQIASVGGVSSPSFPVGSFASAPDIVLPSNQSNPVTVVVNAANIPAGTTVTVTALPPGGSSASGSASLTTTSGSSSTANVSITLPSGFSVLTASTTVNLAANGKPMMLNGEKVDKIEVAARYGGGSLVTYVTRSGRRIDAVR